MDTLGACRSVCFLNLLRFHSEKYGRYCMSLSRGLTSSNLTFQETTLDLFENGLQRGRNKHVETCLEMTDDDLNQVAKVEEHQGYKLDRLWI